MKNIGVLVSGSGTNLQAIIDNTENNNINGKVKLIISNKEDAFSLERGKKHNIENYFVGKTKDNVNREDFKNLNQDEKILKLLKENNIDLVVLAGYLSILSEDLISEYENKIINIHPSLIPSFCGKGYYGLKVHEKVIEYGVKITGATVHFVNEQVDYGAVIMQDTVVVDVNDTPLTLQQKVLKVEHRILVESVKKFCEDKIKVQGRKVFIL